MRARCAGTATTPPSDLSRHRSHLDGCDQCLDARVTASPTAPTVATSPAPVRSTATRARHGSPAWRGSPTADAAALAQPLLRCMPEPRKQHGNTRSPQWVPTGPWNCVGRGNASRSGNTAAAGALSHRLGSWLANCDLVYVCVTARRAAQRCVPSKSAWWCSSSVRWTYTLLCTHQCHPAPP